MKKTLSLLLFAIILFSSCTKDNGFKVEVANQADDFLFVANDISNGTRTFEYGWTNTSTVAGVTISPQGEAAEWDMKVYDAANNEVYSNSLDNTGSTETNPGISGLWRIVLVFKNFNGSIQVALKKVM